MFGNNTKKPSENTSSASTSSTSNAINSLVNGTSIKGSLIAKSDMRIDGLLEGDLVCHGRVIIGSEGKVIGDVECTNAIIEGHFQGTLKVKDELDIKETGSVNGDVNTGKLRIAPGGIFNVNCNMDGKKIKSIKAANGAEA